MKHRSIAVVLLLVALLSTVGCAAKTYQLEQSALRRSIIDLYEEQLKDNLTRAYERQPFIHVTYKQITGEVTIQASGQLTSSESNPPKMGVTTMLQMVLGAMHVNKINVQSFPVIDNEDVYRAYTQFAQDPRYFGRVSQRDASSEVALAHLSWERGGYVYYVKPGGRDAFQDLIIRTTVAVKSIEVTVKSLVRTILEAVEVTGQPGYEPVEDKMQHFLQLTFDAPVKNIDGKLKVNLDANVERVFEVQPLKSKELKDETNQLILFYSEKNVARGHDIDPASLKKKLIGATVTLELRGLDVQRVPIEALNPSLRLQRELLEELRARPLTR